MDKKINNRKPMEYLIRVKSYLELHWEQWFEGMKIKHTEDGCTILVGKVNDQASLYGLLERIRNLNLTLISVKAVDQ